MHHSGGGLAPPCLRTVLEVEWSKEVKTLDLDQELLPPERTLGILWQVEPNTYGFDVHLEERPLTRCGLLSTVSSVYPFGFVSPFILKAEMLFQELCQIKLGWDDAMTTELREQWCRWLQDLPLIQNFAVPRCLEPKGFQAACAKLHRFADALEWAFRAVSYLRLVDMLSGEISVFSILESVKCQALSRKRTGRYMTSCDVSKKPCADVVCSSEREKRVENVIERA